MAEETNDALGVSAQIGVEGKVDFGDLFSGLGELDNLFKQLGVSSSKLSKELYDALYQIDSSSDDAATKMQQRLEALSTFYQGAVEQFGELNLNKALSPEQSEQVNAMIEQLGGVLQKIQEISSAAPEIKELFGEGLGEVSENAGELKNRLTELANTESYESLKQQIAETKQELADYVELYEKLAAKENKTEEEKEQFLDLQGAIEGTTKRLEEMQAKLKEAPTATFRGEMEQTFNTFKEKFGETQEWIGQGIHKLGDWFTGNGKVKESINEIGKAFEGLPIPIKGALASVKQLTAGLLKLAATPVGAVLTVIVLAVKALSEWFKKSAEGQKAYAAISAYLSSVLLSLSDIVVKLGGYLYHAFADAGAPMNAFAKSFVNTFKTAIETVIHLLQGIGNTGKGLFEGLTGKGWDTFKKGIDQTWEGIKGAGKTVAGIVTTAFEGVFGATKIASEGISKAAETNLLGSLSEINKRAQIESRNAVAMMNAQKEIGVAKQHQAELDIQIAENMSKIYQATGKEKAELIAITKELKRQKYEGWTDADGTRHRGILEIQKEELDIQRQKNQMHSTSIADLAKERELQTQIYKTQAEAASSLRMLNRLEAQNERKMARGENTADKNETKLAELDLKNEIEREQTLVALEQKLVEARIDAMEEGYGKVAATRQAQNDAEIKQLDEEEAKMILAERKRQKAYFDAKQAIIAARGGKAQQWTDDMFEENDDVKAIRDYYKQLRTYAIATQLQEEIKNEDTLIQSHASYTDRKAKIDKEYAETVASINAAIVEAEKRGDAERVDALNRSLAEAAKQRAKSQADLSLAELKESPDYIRAFEDLRNTSTETLEELIKKFEETKASAAKNLKPNELREYTDAIQKMKDELIERNPFAMLKESMEDVSRAQAAANEAQKLYDGVKEGAKVIKGVTAENGKLTIAYWSEANALENLKQKNDDLNKSQNRFTKNIKEATSQIDKLASGLSSLGNAIGGTAGEVLNIISSVVTFTTTTINSIATIARETSAAIRAVETASLILTIATTALSIINKIRSISQRQKEEKKQKEQEIEDLRRAVEDYRLAVLEAKRAEDSWFASTGIGSLAENYKKMQNALEAYQIVLTRTQQSGASDRALGYDRTYPGIGERQEGQRGGRTGSNRENATDKELYDTLLRLNKSSLYGKTISEQLRNEVGIELWGEDGMIDINAAQLALETLSDAMDATTKHLLENLIEQKKAWDEYVQAVEDYVSDMYSPLVDNLTDAVWEWLNTGKDVIDSFEEYASDSFANIGKEMVKQLLLDNVFSGFKERLKKIYMDYASGGMTYGDLLNAVTAATAEMKDNSDGAIEQAKALAKAYEEAAASIGFDISKSSAADQKASAIAADKITYEQADRIEGILVAMMLAQEQGLHHTIENSALMLNWNPMIQRIDTNIAGINTGVSSMVDMHRRTNEYLETIEINTRPIPTMAEDLQIVRRKIEANY